MSKIKLIRAREILDSRGNPTVEVEIQTERGVWARAAVPSGASTGSREVCELRDGDSRRFMGRGVLKAVDNVNGPLAQALVGRDVADGPQLDQLMIDLDGREDKSALGANGILGISLCVARAACHEQDKPLFRYLRENISCPTPKGESHASGAHTFCLPAPMMNIINGGRHGANNLDIQEFMIVPRLRGPFRENLRAAVEIFQHLKQVLSSKNLSTNVGDEGGFAPHLDSHEQAIELIMQAVEKAGYRPGEDISLALDCAASEFYRDGIYTLRGKGGKACEFSSGEMVEYLRSLAAQYPIYSIEDGMAEDDYTGWQELTTVLGDQVLLVGDDLFVTNPKILQGGIERGEANAILVKVNQIGTLSETFAAMAMAFGHNYQVVVSHRSGETGDDFIADLAVATSCGHLKAGSASRSDRVEKYNRLLRIEEQLGGDKAPFYQIKG